MIRLSLLIIISSGSSTFVFPPINLLWMGRVGGRWNDGLQWVGFDEVVGSNRIGGCVVGNHKFLETVEN